MSQSHSHSPFEAKWFGAETQTSHRRTSTAVKSAIAGLILTSTLILLWTLEYNYPRRIPFAKLLPPAISPTSHLIFNEEVVLTYKTGSAVIFNRVPTWLLDLSAARQMPCHHHRGWAEYIPNQAYYSDTATTLGDVTFKDILANVSDYVRGMDDFQEYYRVHQSLLNRVDPAIVAKTAAAANEPIPKGWALDKFKFLPLHGDAYRKWPVAKWQVSIEDDTFVFWNQLLKWLKTQDHDAHRLYGNPTLLVVSAAWAAASRRFCTHHLMLSLSHAVTLTERQPSLCPRWKRVRPLARSAQGDLRPRPVGLRASVGPLRSLLVLRRCRAVSRNASGNELFGASQF